MIIINFAQPFKEMQQIQAEVVLEHPIERVIELPLRLDGNIDLLPQMAKTLKLLDAHLPGLQAESLAVNLPAHPLAAVLVMARLRARLGAYPRVLRTRVRPYGLMAMEEVIEAIDPGQAET